MMDQVSASINRRAKIKLHQRSNSALAPTRPTPSNQRIYEVTLQSTLFIMSVETVTTISPITNKPILTRTGLSDADLQTIPEKAASAFDSYRRIDLAERQQIVKKALKLLNERKDELAKEITEQMGRPISYTPKEISTAVARGDYLLKISGETLKDTEGEAEKGFKRYIRKVPVGPVLILFPWNVSSVATATACIVLINTTNTCLAVPIPHPGEFDSACIARWQFCHPQAFASNADECRADPASI